MIVPMLIVLIVLSFITVNAEHSDKDNNNFQSDSKQGEFILEETDVSVPNNNVGTFKQEADQDRRGLHILHELASIKQELASVNTDNAFLRQELKNQKDVIRDMKQELGEILKNGESVHNDMNSLSSQINDTTMAVDNMNKSMNDLNMHIDEKLQYIHTFINKSTAESNPDGLLRIVGGSVTTMGNIEIYQKGEWETVCEDSSLINYTDALCRLVDFRIRLVGSHSPNKGRVEVMHLGRWGTICDDGWDINAARVICRMLGYRNAVAATKSAMFGEGVGPIHIDDVRCEGNEASIVHCSHKPLGIHDCKHNEDAGVICN